MQNLGLETPFMGGFRNKIKHFCSHYLVCRKCMDVGWKIV